LHIHIHKLLYTSFFFYTQYFTVNYGQFLNQNINHLVVGNRFYLGINGRCFNGNIIYLFLAQKFTVMLDTIGSFFFSYQAFSYMIYYIFILLLFMYLSLF